MGPRGKGACNWTKETLRKSSIFPEISRETAGIDQRRSSEVVNLLDGQKEILGFVFTWQLTKTNRELSEAHGNVVFSMSDINA